MPEIQRCPWFFKRPFHLEFVDESAEFVFRARLVVGNPGYLSGSSKGSYIARYGNVDYDLISAAYKERRIGSNYQCVAN